MGRTPCCAQQGLKREPWSPEEDELLINYINQYGYRNWSSIPKNAGLQRCGISCRLPWTNYLAGEMGRTPCDEQGLKKEKWSSEEDELLINYNNQHGHGNWDSNAKTAGEMRRAPCYDKQGLKKGAWSFEEDELLINYINRHGYGNWKSLPKNAGLQRKGKSCRFRWTNYLRPGIKRGPFTPEEENLVIQLHTILGNRWSAIAIQLPGRTDNEIKNLWNTHLKKRLVTMGLVPQPHEPNSKEHGPKPAASPSTRHKAQWESVRLEAEARLSRESLIYKYSPHCSSSSYPDVYLRLWNSEVGESFRKVAKNIKTENSTCQSPVAQISSSTQRPGRTDNEIKNDWNTNLKKRLVTMDLDPQTHEPTSKAASRSTSHKAQWESARLEAEARFSRESLIYNPHGSSSSYCDVYLRLWNSEVGESFRKVGKKIKTEKSTCQSPVSETCPSTKCAFSSGLTQRDEDIEVIEDSKSHIVLLNAKSTSSCSDVVDDDFLMSELQLLLDFPENNDMSFLENPSYDYFDYPSVLSND